MRTERLVAMANDIGAFFKSAVDQSEAATSVASHLKRFWEPRMRREIIAHYEQGGEGLDPIVRTAVGILATQQQ